MILLVTGASSGIGRATAVAAARRGATVVLAARNPEDLEETARLCRASSGTAEVAVTDVTDPDAVARTVEDVVRRHGRLDAVVHAAAVLAYGRFEEIPDEEFDAVLDVNIRGSVIVARTALRQFRRQGDGHLVLLGSLLGDAPTSLMSPYVVSKFAVHGLARVLQIELRTSPVEVSLVAPAGVRTAIYRVAANHLGVRGRPPPPVYDADTAADVILDVLDRPRRKKRVGTVVNLLATTTARLAPRVYDPLIDAYVRIGGLTRRRIAPTEGNVHTTRPHDDVPAPAREPAAGPQPR